jgi:hypothetical protein
MANTENINVETTKEVIDAAVQAVEAIPVKPNNKFGVIGMVVVGGAAIITGIGLTVRHFKNKKKAKEAAATGADNVDIAKDDFEEVDSAEE